MGELNTISDSKEAFFKEFPYVIPHVFRKVADELLVELHLLSHNNKFQIDHLFALGLTKAFNDLTSGYDPKSHIESLFDALCNSSSIDPSKVRNEAEKKSDLISELTIEDLDNYIKGQEDNKQVGRILSSENKFYNRLTLIGILNVVSTILKKDSELNISKLENLSVKVSEKLGFTKERVEKDISIYMMSVDKLNKSLELIKLINEKNKEGGKTV